jgi:5'-nucleotidase (lipoprotein e(P4) family)
MTKPISNIDRRRLMATILSSGLAMPLVAGSTRAANKPSAQQPPDLRNPLLWAVAWSETAAEFGALCHQAFNLATLRVDQATQNRRTSNRPLAVITDLDNTILHASSYWGYLIRQGLDFFDDSLWDQWIPENLVTLVPGAFEFLKHCETNEVEVFYVTNRNQGPKTFEYALTQLQRLNLPYADASHLTVYQETSDKTPSRKAVDQTHELILLLGDNLNDFKRDYYVSDVNKRYELMERDKSELGKKFIILPNATDGHWVRAIFGESEPAATEANRRLLLSAATRKAWDGKPTQNTNELR